MITWLCLSRIPHNKSHQGWKHQAGRRETLLLQLSRILADAHSKLWSSTTKKKPFPDTWALPNVKNATFAVNRWCTHTRCYSRNARTIGCGRRRHCQSPLSGSWIFKHWGITYSFDNFPQCPCFIQLYLRITTFVLVFSYDYFFQNMVELPGLVNVAKPIFLSTYKINLILIYPSYFSECLQFCFVVDFIM